MIVSEQLKARVGLKMKQEELATRMGVTKGYISRSLNGATVTPKFLNDVLDVIEVSESIRAEMNVAAAREVGWRF